MSTTKSGSKIKVTTETMDTRIVQLPMSPVRRAEPIPRRDSGTANTATIPSSGGALLQHEIDMWSSLAAKTKVSKQQMEDEANAFLMANAMSALRDLQKEICDTDWIFDSSYS